MNMTDHAIVDFFTFARERYNIYLRRQAGDEPPWTKDPVLQKYYFCNIYREDDKTTIWVKKHIRDPYQESPDIGFMMAVARFINRIESLEWIRDLLGDVHDRNFWTSFRRQLSSCHPIVTGAYMIRTPTGFEKLDGVIEVLKPIRLKSAMVLKYTRTLESAHRALARFDFVGGFMAYEIVSDLRHTPMLWGAPDVNTWAHPGPGCTRGLRHLLWNRDERLSSQDKLFLLRTLLMESEVRWPAAWPSWEMREVEHTLCEYDKYKRGQAGEHLKRRYR